MLDASPFDVRVALAPVRRALGVGRAERFVLWGLSAGMLAAALAVVAARAAGSDAPVVLLILFPAALGAGLGAALAVRSWPRLLDAARVTDRYFDLKDRLTTALELHAGTHPLAEAQREDASRRIAGLAMTESARGAVGRREIGAVAIAALLLAAALLWSNSASATSQAGGRGDSATVRHAVKHILPAVRRSLTAPLPTGVPADPSLRKLNAALAALQRQLLHTSTRAGALRAISATQANIRRITAALHPVSPRAAAAAAPALRSAMTPRERAAAAGGGKRAQAAMASALKRLAASLQHMSPAQRAQLARALAQAANATSDSRLSAQLHQAASSLGYHDPQTAAQALQSAASMLQRSPGQSEAQSRAAAASSSLESLKQQIAGLNSQSAGSQQSGSSAGQSTNGQQSGGQPSGATGKGRQGGSQGKGQGTSPGSGAGQGQSGKSGSSQGSGTGQGKGAGQGRGQGQGQGQGRGQGNGSGQGQGRGGTGGHGIGGGRGGAGPQGQGRFATVYTPVKAGKGQSTIQNGPNGTPQGGGIVPYRRVIARYSAAAHSALDQSPLPPSLRSYVRTYFSTISH